MDHAYPVSFAGRGKVFRGAAVFVIMTTDKSWSAEQEAVFSAVKGGVGHIVLKAPAGSGKTTTVMEAVRQVVGQGEILVVSFGKEISKELAERVSAAKMPGVYVSTLHSFGRRSVTRAFPRAQCEEGKTTIIADKLYSEDRGYKYQRVLLAKAVSVAKNQLLSDAKDIDVALEKLSFALPDYVNRPLFLKRVGQLVAASREETSMFDMDDMIWLPVVLGLPVPTYAFVFIDETQDLNKTQLELALRAADLEGGRIVAVGDERQAIYGFRGAGGKASIARIVDGLGANVMRLTTTYRCAKAIVSLAQATVSHFEAAPGAPEGEVVSGDWSALRSLVKGGDLVVSRTNAPLIREVMLFVSQGRPACFLGRDAGAELSRYCQKSKATDVRGLVDWASTEAAKDAERCEKKGLDPRRITDRFETIAALADGAGTIADFYARIETFFVAERGEDTVAFSTTHQAKGLEADSVFVFADTFSPGRSEEDDNLWYVAITRAKTSLFLCEGANPKKVGS